MSRDELFARDACPEFFRDALANLFRQPLLDAASTKAGGLRGDNWCRGGDRNGKPNQRGKRKSSERADFEDEGVVWFQIANYGESHQEDKSRNGGESDESKVDGPVQALATAAVFTLGEVGLVVAAHFGK